MSIQKYQAFIKVVEMGSISKAADELGYTQSAVSRMVADLENEWGFTLLRRSRGGLSLSSDGIVMLPYIQELCAKYRDLQERSNSLRGLDTGIIRIGSITSISSHWLPGLIKKFEMRYPNIAFQLFNMDYANTEKALLSGEIDCGFVCMPCSDGIDVTVLHTDPAVAILPPDHPLAAADKYPLQRLSDERVILLADEHNSEVAKVIDKLSSKLERPMNPYCYVNDDYSIMAMVEANLGVSVLYELSTERMPFDIVFKQFDPPITRELGIAVKKGVRPSPATEKFIQLVKTHFSSL